MPAPLEKPAIVPEARSAPVGTPPAVARSDIVRFGVVPTHDEQKSSTEAWVSWPVLLGVKVWPTHAVEFIPKPVLDTFRFCWLTPLSWPSRTAPGVVTRSQPVGVPAWNAFWELSVKQSGFVDVVSPRSWVVVPPLGTEMLAADAVVKPSL